MFSGMIGVMSATAVVAVHYVFCRGTPISTILTQMYYESFSSFFVAIAFTWLCYSLLSAV